MLLVHVICLLMVWTASGAPPTPAPTTAAPKKKTESQTFSPTASSTISFSKEITQSGSNSKQSSQSRSVTISITSVTPIPTPSNSPTSSKEFSVTKSVSGTASTTTTLSQSASFSASVSKTFTRDFSVTKTRYTTPPFPTPTATFTLSMSSTWSPSITSSEEKSASRSATFSNTATVSKSPTREVSTSNTPSMTLTRTQSQSWEWSRTVSISVTPPPTPSHTPTMTMTQSSSMSTSSSASSTATYTLSTSASSSASRTLSREPTLTRSASFTSSEEITSTRSNTSSNSYSVTLSMSHTGSTTFSSEVSTTRTLTSSKSSSKEASSTRSVTFSDSTSFSLSASASRSVSSSSSSTKEQSTSWSVSSSSSSSASLTASQSKEITLSSSTNFSATPSFQASETKSQTVSIGTNSSVATATPVDTISKTKGTPSFSRVATSTASVTASLTTTNTYSLSATQSNSVTGSASQSYSLSISTSTSVSTSFTLSLSQTMSVSSSATLTVSSTSSVTISTSQTQTHSASTSLSNEATESDTTSLSKSTSVSLSDSLSDSFSATTSMTISDEYTKSMTLLITETGSGSLSVSITYTMTESRVSPSGSGTYELTTSALPPTTTPVPTPTMTLPTRCPTDCVKGTCQQASAFGQYIFFCSCYASSAQGYWAGSEKGGPCDKCARGYYGLRCLAVCPGGSCSICSGHGTCADGLYGDGSCSCMNSTTSGFWTGMACNSCQSGYYGQSCTGVCQCDVHGTCSQGLAGDGKCKCAYGWMGTTCSTCDASHNDNCASEIWCPGQVTIASKSYWCSNHGYCNTTLSSKGTCVCDPNYAAAGCDVRCPNDCSGHGFCNQGSDRDGSCSCNPRYAAPDCAKCIKGYYGASGGCTKICPGGVVSPCSGNGTCLDSGVCSCFGTKGGDSCNLDCPVASYNKSIPCGGHGTCAVSSMLTTYCSCYTTPTLGYWQGGTCEECDGYHGGQNCDITCPVANNLVCSNNGLCNKTNGACSCFSNYCGRYCEVQKVNGVCEKCANDTNYGFDCTGVCLCEHGACSNGKAGDGSCACDKGYGGTYCNITCPGGTTNPCSGNGDCIQATTTCSCMPGYAGATCNMSCPRSQAGVPCGVNGKCFDGNDGNGTCLCNTNYVWPSTACDSVCNCNGHGSCIQPKLQCVCDTNYNGTSCERCADGKFGAFCNQTCTNGFTNGYLCTCNLGFAGLNCSISCPSTANGICNGQGRCDNFTGLCSCFDTMSSFTKYQGPGCTCNDAMCKANNTYTVCSSTTGTCVCRALRTGPTCAQCTMEVYGSGCDIPCDCNSHGSCDQNTGICNCFANSVDGYWAGGTCNQCSAGYMGKLCDKKSNNIAQLNDLSRKVSVSQQMYFAFIADRSLVVGGTGFIAKFNITTSSVTVPETNTLSVTTDNVSIYTTIYAMQRRLTDPSGVIFLGYPNSTDKGSDPILYTATLTPLITQVKNVTNRAIGQLGELSPPFLGPIIDQSRNQLCIVSSQASKLYCKGIPSDSNPNPPPVALQLPLSVIFATLQSNYLGLSLYSGLSLRSSCTIVGVAIGTNPTVTATPLDVLAQLAKESPSASCSSVGAMNEANGLFFYCGLMPTQYIGVYNYSNRSFLIGQALGGTSSCRAIIYDAESNIGLAAFSSLVVKFELVPNVNGTMSVSAYGQLYTTSPLISTFLLDSVLQIVYAPLQTAMGYQILRFGLVEIISYVPSYADRKGGALITVTGKGFRNISNGYCLFDKELVSAMYINPTTIVCTAPEKVSSAVCLSQVLEVSFNGVVSANGFLVQRPSSVIILSATPNFARVGDVNKNVTISGRGFSDSPYAVCKFYDPVSGAEVVTGAVFSRANFSYSCIAPTVQVPWSSSSALTISLDGFVFSDPAASISFLFIGAAIGVEFVPSFVVESSTRTTLGSNALAYVIDANKNRLLSIDNETRVAVITPPNSSTQDAWILANNTKSSSRGITDFSAFALINPPSGNFVFNLTMSGWVTSFLIIINPGAVVAMVIKIQPQVTASDIIVPGKAMPRQVAVAALDAGGNFASAAAGYKALVYFNTVINNTMNATRIPITTALFTTGGTAVVGSLTVTPLFGFPYGLLFVYEPNPSVTVLTNTFFGGCPSNQYFIVGENACRDCVADQFTCNGTNIIVALEQNWRPSLSSPAFYQCPIEGSCLAGGSCALGYTGPLCAVCIPGFGKDFTNQCAECPFKPISIVIFVFVALFQFLLILFFTIVIIQNWEALSSIYVQCVVTALIAMYLLQFVSMYARLDMNWPPIVQYALSLIGMIFAFELHRVRAINCLLIDQGIDAVWFAVIYSVIVVMLIPTIAVLAQWLLKHFPEMTQSKPAMEVRHQLQVNAEAHLKAKLVKKARHRDGRQYIKEHQRKAVWLNAAQVVLTFCFQTSCRAALDLFKCTSVIYSELETRRYLTADFTVSCDSDNYQAIFNYSTFLVGIYVIAIPCLFIFGVAYSRKANSEDDFRLYTAPSTLGVQDSAFFWNGLLFFMKASLIADAVFLKHPIQGWVGMWLITLMAWIHFYTTPRIKGKHTRVEGVGFGFICLIANIMLMLPSATDGTAFQLALKVVIMTLVCGLVTFLCYEMLYVSLREIQAELKLAASRDPEEFENNDDGEVLIGMADVVNSQAMKVKEGFLTMVAGMKHALTAPDEDESDHEVEIPAGYSSMPTRAMESSFLPSRGGLSDAVLAEAKRSHRLDQDSEMRTIVDSSESSSDFSSSDDGRTHNKVPNADLSTRLLAHPTASFRSDDRTSMLKNQSFATSAGAFSQSDVGDERGIRVDPSEVRRMELEQDIDDYIMTTGFGVYRQNPHRPDQLYDSRDPAAAGLARGNVHRPQAVEAMLARHAGGLKNVADSSDSDDRTDSDI